MLRETAIPTQFVYVGTRLMKGNKRGYYYYPLDENGDMKENSWGYTKELYPMGIGTVTEFLADDNTIYNKTSHHIYKGKYKDEFKIKEWQTLSRTAEETLRLVSNARNGKYEEIEELLSQLQYLYYSTPRIQRGAFLGYVMGRITGATKMIKKGSKEDIIDL